MLIAVSMIELWSGARSKKRHCAQVMLMKMGGEADEIVADLEGETDQYG